MCRGAGAADLLTDAVLVRVQMLQAKVRKLEHLLTLKDIRIDDLQRRLDGVRPTASSSITAASSQVSRQPTRHTAAASRQCSRSAVQCSAVQRNAMRCRVVSCRPVQSRPVPRGAVPRRAAIA